MSVSERVEALGGRVTITADDLVEAVNLKGHEAGAPHLLAVATALVERYAPCAPEAVQNEACIRVVGYLTGHTDAATMSETVGPITTSYAVGSLSALRHSGAMALLSPWKVRRGGVI